MITVDVEIGGPTTSSDLYSFAFDVKLGDPTVFSFVSGSERAGDALVPGSGQFVEVHAAQSADRVVVGVSKAGGGSGNGVVTDSTVVSLSFRALKSGTCSLTFDGIAGPSNPAGDPLVLDSQGLVVPSITFDGASASLRAG